MFLPKYEAMNRQFILLILFLVVGCNPKQSREASIDMAAYKLQIETWHKERVENLRGPSGWLNLAGLYWLEEGVNTFGSGLSNNIVFPEGKIAERAGFFLLRQNAVRIEVAPGVEITTDNLPLKSGVIFHLDSVKTPLLKFGSLQWFVIRRDNKYGIRLRDLANPELKNFTGIDRFPVDPIWRLEATWEKASSARTIEVTNILGQTTAQLSPGTVAFTAGGKAYQLDALDEGGNEYFIIFGDRTNAKETYGAGRYLYVNKPDENGKMAIDFNKSINPPCAFTEFATCPLPPQQNVLDLEIPAGEKNYERH